MNQPFTLDSITVDSSSCRTSKSHAPSVRSNLRIMKSSWRWAIALWMFFYQLYLHAALCLDLTFQMIDFLKKGTKTWIVMLIRLLAFTTLMIPGWFHLVTYWLFNKAVVRNISYADSSEVAQVTDRNYLDIYLPQQLLPLKSSRESSSKTVKKLPVIIFVSGGAWIIGYKMWSALVARGLSQLGNVVICPDYKNAPQTDIEGMMDDISRALKWTIKSIDTYGGDCNNIILAGQSAGAHISMALMIDCFDKIYWRPSGCNNELPTLSNSRSRLSANELQHIKLIVGVSGPYNLQSLNDHLHIRGLDASILNWICKGNIDKYSPTLHLKKTVDFFSVKSRLMKEKLHFPYVALFHGSDDKTVPAAISDELQSQFQRAGIDSECHIYDGYSHTDAILEGPIGGNNILLHDILNCIKKKILDTDPSPQLLHNAALQSNAQKDTIKGIINIDTPLAPRWLVAMARKINPF